MSISFQPDRYNIQVTNRWTSNSGRWIIFLGQHYDGVSFCWDVGQFQTTTGACQRLHFKENKTGAVIEYDQLKDALKKLKANAGEPAERYHIFGPDGKPAD